MRIRGLATNSPDPRAFPLVSNFAQTADDFPVRLEDATIGAQPRAGTILMSKSERKRYEAILDRRKRSWLVDLGIATELRSRRRRTRWMKSNRPESESLQFAICTVNRI